MANWWWKQRVTEVVLVDEPLSEGGGLSPERADELRKLLPVLEERMKQFQGNVNFQEIASEVRNLRTAVEEHDKVSAQREIVRSVRNISEGIVGGVVLELIPQTVKSWVKSHLFGVDHPAKSTVEKEETLYIIKIEIAKDGLHAIDTVLYCERPAILTFSVPHMRIWCGSTLAVLLRLSLDRTWIEYPTQDELEEMKSARFTALTPENAAKLRAEVARHAHAVAAHSRGLYRHSHGQRRGP